MIKNKIMVIKRTLKTKMRERFFFYIRLSEAGKKGFKTNQALKLII